MTTIYLIHCVVELPFSPLDSFPLKAIRYKDVAAIVEILEVSKCEGRSPEELKNWLMDFQSVNIRIFKNQTMVPLRFGTFINSREEIKQWLAFGYYSLKSALRKANEMGEFAVHVFWNLPDVLNEIRQEEEMGNLTNPVEVGRKLFEFAEIKRKHITEAVHRKLSLYSSESTEMKISDEAMIFNRSYLVNLSRESEFDQAMIELGKENKSYLRFKYFGPLPLNSFVSLQFKKERFELIDWARKTLNLPEKASFEEVRAAYRKQAFLSHPDKNNQVPISSMNSLDTRNAPEWHTFSGIPKDEFEEIATAYSILKRFCWSLSKIGSKNNRQVSFMKPDVEQVFVSNGTV